jgi:hypothetical protein
MARKTEIPVMVSSHTTYEPPIPSHHTPGRGSRVSRFHANPLTTTQNLIPYQAPYTIACKIGCIPRGTYHHRERGSKAFAGITR